MTVVTTALTDGISSIATSSLGAIGAVLPVALPILGAFVVVKIGIHIFKKVTA